MALLDSKRSVLQVLHGLFSPYDSPRSAGVVSLILFYIFVCHQQDACAQSLVGKQHQTAMTSSLIGEWITNVGRNRITLELRKDGQFLLGELRGEYSLQGRILKLHAGENTIDYQVELTADQLTLSGGDLTEPLKFSRTSGIVEARDWLSELSPRAVESKLRRVAVILIVVLVCRLVTFVLRAVVRFVIYSEWGPLKFIYRYHKNRTMTLYSLALNLSKYVIYILAVGFVLNELGINYTAYLASLSVIGLAIGFGSQGLVQDMVTGFFIFFEEQFNVGDMVEIPPHVGIVEEIGLRMTRLRNYLGQKVVIPNRNIAAVGNYAKGAQQAYVDVATVSSSAAQQACKVLKPLAHEIGRQFEGIIIHGPEVLGPMSLTTGEHFTRMEVAIWPQQQWVLEQQLVPRIKDILKKTGLEVADNRVAVFYHPRENLSIPHRPRKKGESDEV